MAPAALTVFDMTMVIFALVMFPVCGWCWATKPTPWLADPAVTNVTCEFCQTVALPYLLPVISTAQCCSVWTCVAMTVDRFLAIKYPIQSRRWCTTQRTRAILTVILAGR